MVSFDVNATDLVRRLQAFHRALNDVLTRNLDRLGEDSVRHLRGGLYYKKRSGQANRKTDWKNVGPMHRRLVVDVPYAHILDEGAKPHTIAPGKKRTLKFVTEGVTLFRYAVNHPGHRGFQFTVRERAWIRGELEVEMNRAVDRAKADSGL